MMRLDEQMTCLSGWNRSPRSVTPAIGEGYLVFESDEPPRTCVCGGGCWYVGGEQGGMQAFKDVGIVDPMEDHLVFRKQTAL